MSALAKKIKKHSELLQWLIPTFIFTAYMILSLVSYTKKSMDTTFQNVVDNMGEQVAHYTSNYERNFDSYMLTTQSVADYLVSTDDLFDPENLVVLDAVCNNYPFTKGYIVKPDYSAIDTDGGRYEDISLMGIFSKLSFINAGLTDFCLSTEGAMAYVSAPIKSNDKVLGIVVFEYVSSEIGVITDTADYISTNVYAVISSDGVIVDRAGLEGAFMERGSNIYSKTESYKMVNGSAERMKSDLEKGAQGYFVAKLNANNERYFFYCPMGESGTFFIMSVNSAMINQKVEIANKSTNSLMVGSLVVLSIFILTLVFILIMNMTRSSKANKELINKAQTDLLTDLLNKIATEDQIKDYLQGEGKDKRSMMFVLDIDNFKNINDTMGHAFGDEVIATLGKQLRAEFRVNDIVGRTGGDEFTIFLKDLKDDNLLKSEANRVLGIFKNFKVGEYTKYFATASIGVSIYPQDADSFEGLYKAADQALYKAKNRGKNQMAFYKEDF